MRYLPIAALAAVAACGAPTATSSAIVGTAPVTADFHASGISFEQFGQVYEFRSGIVQAADGTLLFCGVGAYTRARFRQGVDDIMKSAIMRIGGQEVVRDFRFFAEANRPSQLDDAAANCASTGYIPDGTAPEIEITSGHATVRI